MTPAPDSDDQANAARERRGHTLYDYGMILFPELYHYGAAPEEIVPHGFDQACRDILRVIAPDVFARLAGARHNEQVEVRIRIEVGTWPAPARSETAQPRER